MNPILLDSPICRATFHVTTCSSNCPQTGILTGHEDTGMLHSPGLTWTIASTEHTKSATEGYKKRDVLPDFPEARIIILLLHNNNRPSLDSSHTASLLNNRTPSRIRNPNFYYRQKSYHSPPFSNTVSHTSPLVTTNIFSTTPVSSTSSALIS